VQIVCGDCASLGTRMSEAAKTKARWKQDWLWTVYVISPWVAYPFLVILRESILGYRCFSFDWLGGHA
jgi:hypothetical protein